MTTQIAIDIVALTWILIIEIVRVIL